jgi:hypothetical protein
MKRVVDRHQRLGRLDGCCHVLNTLSTLISFFRIA